MLLHSSRLRRGRRGGWHEEFACACLKINFDNDQKVFCDTHDEADVPEFDSYTGLCRLWQGRVCFCNIRNENQNKKTSDNGRGAKPLAKNHYHIFPHNHGSVKMFIFGFAVIFSVPQSFFSVVFLFLAG